MTEKRTPVDLNNPNVGFYLTRIVKGGPFMPCAIWRPCPIEMEPEFWNALDRWPRLQAMRAGEPVPVEWIWPVCARWPIDAADYRYRMAVKDWAEEHAPWSPEAKPREAVDLNAMRPIF
jgi:hypothetical protein